MNINDLANLDIKDFKNIDYLALLKELKKRPDIIIEVVSILLIAVLCFYFYGTNKKEFAELGRNLAQVQQKYSIYEDLTKAQNALKSLKGVLPEALSESKIIDIVTATAHENGINIESFSPAEVKDYPAYKTLSITLNITAKSYADIWRFVDELENNHKTMRIDQWTLNKQDGHGGRSRRRLPRQLQQAVDENNNLVLSIKLTAINFKK